MSYEHVVFPPQQPDHPAYSIIFKGYAGVNVSEEARHLVATIVFNQLQFAGLLVNPVIINIEVVA